jgi:hypothetical protein
MQLNPITAIAVLSIVVVSLLVVGCTTTTQNTVQSTASATRQQQATDPLTVTIKATGSSMQVGSFFSSKAGYTYVFYNATVKNNNVKNQVVSPGFFSLRTSDGRVYDVDPAMYDKSVDSLQNVQRTQPGDIVSGTIIFQLPLNATTTSILYNDNTHKITTNL